MISPECAECEYLDEENKRVPCSLERTIRCKVLHEYLKERTGLSILED